jgi:hypothetical protein
MMLTKLETGLVELFKNSALAKRLRMIESLPDLDADSLVNRFYSDAPAIFIALGSFPVKDRTARPKFGLACVARNSRSHQAVRHGDGVQIGLLDMIDLTMAFADSATVTFNNGQDRVSFEVTGCDMISSEPLFQKGVYAAIVHIQTTGEVMITADLDDLSEFKTFHADYDIDAQQSADERNNWIKEPPDYSTSAPGLSDTVILKE